MAAITMEQQSTPDEHIAGLRNRIDEIDSALVALWKERAAISQEVGKTRVAAGGTRLVLSREREILELLASGTSNGQIALRLDLSSKTVRNHVSNICNKLQVLDRAQAAIAARDAGLGR